MATAITRDHCQGVETQLQTGNITPRFGLQYVRWDTPFCCTLLSVELVLTDFESLNRL